ncbi:hypothetical protein IU436_29485 [Nocardia farcinica]|nr:hypothetical protein [Nocardia puris]MBF6422819.1 hypothetical protein [Nocardia farcinica]MBF6434456.1 hypothetical protein [Nocardia farcinica]MBF6505541.1 hypothetical protein [Nocardia farcinica]
MIATTRRRDDAMRGEGKSKPAGKTKTLQVRVDEETARHFAAIARARRMTESQLLRATISEMLRSSESNVDVLKAELRAEFEAAEAALDELSSESRQAAVAAGSRQRSTR